MALTQYRYGKRKYLNYYIITILSVLLTDFIWAVISIEVIKVYELGIYWKNQQ
jgi:hypothetical protein